MLSKQEFAAILKKRILILDGATGSNLQKAGMPFGVCPEQWIAEHPQVLADLQKEYIKAGSDIVYAPTFGANRIKLKEYGLADKARELNTALVRISKEAVDARALVAGDMTMTGQQLAPLGTLTMEELIDAYKEQAAALYEAGADLIVIETMMRLAETRAALIAVKETCPKVPVIVTMSFSENGKTLYGTDPETAIEVLQALGADAVGLNCSAGPDKMLPVLQKMAAHAQVALAAKPNAGLPKVDAQGNTVYDMEAEAFAAHMKELIKNGAVLIGGCCGTDPAYIAQLVKASVRQRPVELSASDAVYLTTERACTLVTDELAIGYIDPQNNEELAEEYREGCYDTLMDLLDEQLDDEADVVCLSVDGQGIDGLSIIEEVIEEATQCSNLPLAFTSADPKVLERALRTYPGRAGVIAGALDPDTAMSLCGKYGAVLLTKPK